jgi:hypothetical protein
LWCSRRAKPTTSLRRDQQRQAHLDTPCTSAVYGWSKRRMAAPVSRVVDRTWTGRRADHPSMPPRSLQTRSELRRTRASGHGSSERSEPADHRKTARHQRSDTR